MRPTLITLLSILFFATVSSTAQDLQWFANDHFQLMDAPDEALLIAYEKQPWEAFTLYIGAADFSENTVLTFSVQSDAPVTLRIDLMDQAGNQAAGNTATIALKGGADYVAVTYDFGNLAQKVNLGSISHFHFYVNPGAKATGELSIKNIILPKVKTTQEEMPILVFPNPVNDILKIKTTNQLFDEVILFEAQGKEVTRVQISATHYYEWSITDLPIGVYQYQLNYQNETIASDRLLVK